MNRANHTVRQLAEFSSNWAQVLESAGLTENSLKELMNNSIQLTAEKEKLKPKKLVFASRATHTAKVKERNELEKKLVS